MLPELIIGTIKAGFEFGIELLKFLQTPQGAAALEQATKDRAAWDKWWADREKDVKGMFGAVLKAGKQ